MNERLVRYSPEMESPEGFQPGPLSRMASRSTTRSATGPAVFNEGRLLELAAELLEARTPDARAAFLARLIDRSAQALGATAPPASARALQRDLALLAERSLPAAGVKASSATVAAAARAGGLELEGLSAEDKEFELARHFVRAASEHAGQALAAALPVLSAVPFAVPDRGRQSGRAFNAPLHTQEPTMHDIDRTQTEYENEQFEFGENEWSPEAGGGFGEAEEMELATELLSISNEGELDRFLGSLVSRATKAVGSFARSPMGQAVGGVLKGVAKKALPMAGTAIGSYFGGPLGAKIGAGVANAASDALGLEGEMAGEDREFEGAKQFVRMAAQTATQAAAASPGADPRAVAQQAAIAAARQLAPGLLNGAAPASGRQAPATSQQGQQHRAASGRWLRRGNKIVIFGA